MSAVFADAFYFVALLNRADQHHAVAVRASAELRGRIVTTEWVLAEFADALAKSNRRLVGPFISTLVQDPYVTVIHASSELFAQGMRLYDERLDKEWSLTDCISFVVMTKQGLTDALTGDKHFEQAGFRALLK